jgi:hypothetical protein
MCNPCIPTKNCTRCRTGFTEAGEPIYPLLVKGGFEDRFYVCPVCGGSYGESPHPDLV